MTQQAEQVFAAHSNGAIVPAAEARSQVMEALRDRKLGGAALFASLAGLSADIHAQVAATGSIAHVPAAATKNVRNDMFLVLRSGAPDAEAGCDVQCGRNGCNAGISRRPGCQHEIHSQLGEGGRGDRAGARDHGGVEAHRGDGGGTDRQGRI